MYLYVCVVNSNKQILKFITQYSRVQYNRWRVKQKLYNR